MSSNRSHKQRPEDVNLPPISQIFNVASQGSRDDSSLSLPPLRGHEGHRHHHSTAQAYGSSAASQYYPGTPDMRKRARYDQNTIDPSIRSSTSSVNPNDRSTPSSQMHPDYRYQQYTAGQYPQHMSSSANRQQPSAMAVAGEGAQHGRPEARMVPVLGGPSPYSYEPSTSRGMYPHGSPSYSTAGGPSQPGGFHARSHPGSVALHETDSHGEDQTASKTKYECSYCGKGFLRPSALKIHIISHTGDKDFVCPEESCGRRFGVRSNMLRHIRLVHQNMQNTSSGEELSKDEWSE